MKILLASFVSLILSDSLGALPRNTQSKPLIIAHRGASGYLPEHTLEGYWMAMRMGADFIEPDLVVTKDNVLVSRHEPNIINTTDVASHPEFADRRVKKRIDGVEQEGFFVEDFTLAELKTIHAVQAQPQRDQSFNGVYEIPTFEEVIEAVQAYEFESGRRVGIYPETKHPSHFRAMGRPLEEKLVAVLESKGFTDPARIFIQSFEVSNLKDILKPMLESKGLKIPLVQLFDDFARKPYDYALAGNPMTYGDLAKANNLKTIVSSYAAAIGPSKSSIVKRKPTTATDLNGDGKAEAKESLSGEVLPVIFDAHAAGLLVIPWTFRNEEQFLATDYRNPENEYLSFFSDGVDGVITDFTDTAVRTRSIYQGQVRMKR